MKALILLFSVSVLLMACQNETPLDPNVKDGSEELQKLKQELLEKDSLMEAYFKAINEIENNLSVIRENERLVQLNLGSEGSRDQKEIIIEDIKAINELMINNRQRISNLEKQLKTGNVKSVELQKMLARLELSLEEKDMELNRMKNELLKLNNSFENLFSEYIQRVEELDVQTGKINTAYFAIGTVKELIENKVITRQGGFAGIGKTNKVTGDFNRAYFTKIDISESMSIPVYGKNAKLLSNHPSASFAIENKGSLEEIVIKNPEEFWSVSKFLVVQIEK
jgi:hypothetical protein